MASGAADKHYLTLKREGELGGKEERGGREGGGSERHREGAPCA